MSYCRWSSDNWRSDVYCYACVDGTWTTHVAANRIAGDLPPSLWDDFFAEKISAKEFADSERQRHDIIAKAERNPIGLPHDGETFRDAGPAAMKATLLYLRGLGYQVPDFALMALDEEIAEGV
jgi:hypothetical protein